MSATYRRESIEAWLTPRPASRFRFVLWTRPACFPAFIGRLSIAPSRATDAPATYCSGSNSSAAIPHRTLAVILIGRNAHVCSKIVTRSITNITCNASGSESQKQYGNQLPHLITLFARERNSGEIVSPICFAALRLMTNSNFVACCTGRSAGFVPFRILST